MTAWPLDGARDCVPQQLRTFMRLDRSAEFIPPGRPTQTKDREVRSYSFGYTNKRNEFRAPKAARQYAVRIWHPNVLRDAVPRSVRTCLTDHPLLIAPPSLRAYLDTVLENSNAASATESGDYQCPSSVSPSPGGGRGEGGCSTDFARPHRSP